ncbi:hypothetical protein GmRootA79_26420 [Acidovorax sp. A79]
MAAHHCTAAAFTALLAIDTSSITPALLDMSASASSAMLTSVRRRGSVDRTTSLRRRRREDVRKMETPASVVGSRGTRGQRRAGGRLPVLCGSF